jgi:RNA polymerase sigma-70 factor (ECF subfamily)
MNNLQFQQKILSIQDNMYNFALTLTSNRNDAQDLLQETTLKALNNQEKYVENVNFKGWVMTIMRNTFINDYHRMVNSQTIIDQTENLYHLNLPQTSGIETAESSLMLEEINSAINDLDEDLKTPFSMQVAGYKYDEIAETLDLPLGTVKNRIFVARKKLQKKLKHIV